MAKAKKTEKDETESKRKPAAATKKPAASAAAAKDKPAVAAAKGEPAAAKKPAAASPAAAPLIDTNLAASAAAAMILNRAIGGGPAPAGVQGAPAQPAKKESATFKNLKDSLSKPASQGLGGSLGNIAAPKKSNLPFGGGKQVGRNQTFGADVNRAGVPRRTPG